ncbi:MAG: hypothetical protein FJ215_11085 [Ignavibacteria bacterium]|nr:hypothetical protein [Ignavibacteria bacterium]
MTRHNVHLFRLATLYILFAATASAQTKPVPPPRPTEAGADAKVPTVQEREEAKEEPKLPRIDLPEFVITGVARFDPPDIQKVSVEEDGIYRRTGMAQPGVRDVATVELGTRPKERFFRPPGRSFFGVATASYGSFVSPFAFARFGQDLGTLEYALEAQYHRTKGFQKYADRSGGKFAATSAVNLNSASSWLDEAELSGRLGLGSEKYRFYGSIDPTFTRTLGHFDIGGSFVSGKESPIGYKLRTSFKNFSIQDSSEKSRENAFYLGIQGEKSIGSIGIRSGVDFTLTSVGSATDHTLSMTSLYLGTSRTWLKNLFVEIGARYVAARGMENQRISRLAPRAAIGYWFSGMHTVSVTYESAVRFISLQNQIARSPFLNAQSVLKHATDRYVVEGALDSDWNRWLSSRFSVRRSRIDHVPILRDSARTGVWSLSYRGLTDLTTARVGAFANISANDYFAVVVEGNHSRNPSTNGKIPYLPEVEATVRYSHRFSFGLSVTPALQYVHHRPVSADSSGRLPGFLLTSFALELSGIRSLTIFARADNVLDKQYEVWQRYRGLPFAATFGLSYRW